MTTGKRALIVDDSRSARVILSRMLEQHGLTVDPAHDLIWICEEPAGSGPSGPGTEVRCASEIGS